MWKHASPHFSRAVTVLSGFLSSLHRDLWLSRVATGLSHVPSCFEAILVVTVKSVQGRQLYLERIGTLGSFGIVAEPLEFLSSVKLRPPPLEVRRESQDTFPDEAGKWTLISR